MYGIGKQKTKQGIPSSYRNPRAVSSVASNGLFFCSLPTQHLIATMSPRLTGNGSCQNLESVCSTDLRVLAAKFEGRRRSVSRGLAWDVGA